MDKKEGAFCEEAPKEGLLLIKQNHINFGKQISR